MRAYLKFFAGSVRMSVLSVFLKHYLLPCQDAFISSVDDPGEVLVRCSSGVLDDRSDRRWLSLRELLDKLLRAFKPYLQFVFRSPDSFLFCVWHFLMLFRQRLRILISPASHCSSLVEASWIRSPSLVVLSEYEKQTADQKRRRLDGNCV